MKIELENLTFGWKDPLFRNTSRVINSGNIIWLRGENGSGKCTLLLHRAGMIPRFKRGKILEGDVFCAGESLLEHPPKHFFPSLGYISPALVDLYLMTDNLLQELLLAAAVLNRKRETVSAFRKAVTEQMGLKDSFWTADFKALDTSERCKALLTVYLFQGVRFLFLDEVFTGLSAAGLEAWIDLLACSAGTGAGVVFTSHREIPGPEIIWTIISPSRSIEEQRL